MIDSGGDAGHHSGHDAGHIGGHISGGHGRGGVGYSNNGHSFGDENANSIHGHSGINNADEGSKNNRKVNSYSSNPFHQRQGSTILHNNYHQHSESSSGGIVRDSAGILHYSPGRDNQVDALHHRDSHDDENKSNPSDTITNINDASSDHYDDNTLIGNDHGNASHHRDSHHDANESEPNNTFTNLNDLSDSLHHLTLGTHDADNDESGYMNPSSYADSQDVNTTIVLVSSSDQLEYGTVTSTANRSHAEIARPRQPHRRIPPFCMFIFYLLITLLICALVILISASYAPLPLSLQVAVISVAAYTVGFLACAVVFVIAIACYLASGP